MSATRSTLEPPRSVPRLLPQPVDRQRPGPTQEGPDIEEALDKAMVAELSCAQIRRMEREELIRAIHVAGLSLPQSTVVERLADLDRPTLERLLYLVRRSCRHQGY